MSQNVNHDPPSVDLPIVILSKPSRSQNIGSIARVMMNFGYKQLVIYGDVATINTMLADTAAHKTARHAKPLLDNAIICGTLLEVKKILNLQFIIGTISPKRSGGDKNPLRTAFFLETIPPFCYNIENTALLFGTESDGLDNEEIKLCDLLVSIPTLKDYEAMNLSHAAAVILYHFFIKMSSDQRHEKHRPATEIELQLLLEKTSIAIDCLNYPGNEHIVKQCLENIFRRGVITGREAFTLIGMFKRINFKLLQNLQLLEHEVDDKTDSE